MPATPADPLPNPPPAYRGRELAAPPERSNLTPHILALDGVRGLAVLAVMVFHFVAHGPGYNAWPTWLRDIALAGWAGVDVFFVLSGFLITRILMNLRGRSGAMRLFYVRRALRIFPLYYAVVAATAVLLLVQAKLRPSGQEWFDLGAVAVYLTNFNVAVHGWGAAVFRSAQLTHLWTLAIEEQFYLLWPLVVLLAPRRFAWPVCLVLIVLGPIVRFALLHHGAPMPTVYGVTPGRADALAWGAAIAFLEQSRPAHLARISWTLLAIGALVVAGIVARFATVYEHAAVIQGWGYTAIAATAAGGVGLCAAHALPLGARQLLVARPLTRLGRYSYAIYLFHLPLRGVTTATWRRLGEDPFGLSLPQAVVSNAVLFAVSIGLAVLSFWSFEQWFLRLKPDAPPRDG